MYQEMYDHLFDYCESNGGLEQEIKDEVAGGETVEEKLRILIGMLCLPEYGGVEMVCGILGLEFDPEDYNKLVFDCFDSFF